MRHIGLALPRRGDRGVDVGGTRRRAAAHGHVGAAGIDRHDHIARLDRDAVDQQWHREIELAFDAIDGVGEPHARFVAPELRRRFVDEPAGLVGIGCLTPLEGSPFDRTRQRTCCGLRWRDERVGLPSLDVAVPDERLVRRVLEQATDEVRHAGYEIADRRVHACAHAEVLHCFVQGLGHPVQHLHFDRVVGQVLGARRAHGKGDAAGVVARERGPDVAVGGAGDEHRRARLVGSVGGVLVGPDGRLPALRARLDRLDVPVGALHEPDLQRQGERVAGPLDEVTEVVERVDAIRLHDAAELGPFRVARSDLAHQPQRDVLELVVFGVEVDRGVQGARAVSRIGPRRSSASAIPSSAVAGASIGASALAFTEMFTRGTAPHGSRSSNDCAGQVDAARVSVSSMTRTRRCVVVGIGARQRALTEEVDGVRKAVVPELCGSGHGLRRVRHRR